MAMAMANFFAYLVGKDRKEDFISGIATKR
jgi:hypothetical protein